MQKKERMANLEVLRCVAMMMVVVLHYLGKGGLLPDLTAPLSAQDTVAWLLEAFCIVAVNVYMMISGYFLCESSFKLSRLLTLWVQLWLYSVGIGVLAAVTGIVPAAEVSTHYYLTLLFPVTMGHYWFLTAYLFLYILLPFVGIGLRRMTKQQFQVALVLLFVTFCLLKSVLPFRLEEDGKGYDCLWYLCVFCAAAYLRRFGIPFLQKKSRALLLYLIGIFAFFSTSSRSSLCLLFSSCNSFVCLSLTAFNRCEISSSIFFCCSAVNLISAFSFPSAPAFSFPLLFWFTFSSVIKNPL